MKKILIGCAAGTLLLTTGCSSAKDNFQYPEAVEAEITANEFNVSYQLSVKAKENKVYITLSLENPSEEIMPLNVGENGHLFEIWLTGEDGETIEHFGIDKGEREILSGKEKAIWETVIDVNRDEKIAVNSQILLKSDKQNKFNFLNEKQSVEVEVKTLEVASVSLNYSPKETVDYIYQTNSKQKVVESFNFISGNRIQSFTEGIGVKIYSNEQDGLYILATEDNTGEIDGTSYVDVSEMELLIPYSLEEGYEWMIGDLTYKLTDADVRVKTDYKLFKEAVEVTQTDKKGNKKYLYFHKDVGLVKVKQRNKKQLLSKTIYELVDVKKRTSTVEDGLDAEPKKKAD